MYLSEAAVFVICVFLVSLPTYFSSLNHQRLEWHLNVHADATKYLQTLTEDKHALQRHVHISGLVNLFL